MIKFVAGAIFGATAYAIAQFFIYMYEDEGFPDDDLDYDDPRNYFV